MYFSDRPIEEEEELYDREEELRLLRQFATQYSVTLVLGLRRTGKTSLIKVGLKAENTIYVDMRKFEERNAITYSDFLREVEKEVNKRRRKLERLREYLKRVKGVSVGEVGVEFSLGRDRPSFGDLLEAMDEWAREEGRLVFVIDEVQELVKMRGYSLLPSFAYAYDNLRGVSFVFAGSKIGMLFKYLKVEDEESPLFGRYMAKVEVKPFTEEQSVDFLKRGFQQYGVNIKEERLREVARRLGGIPGWLALYGLETVNSGRDSLEDVVEKAFKLASKEFCAFVKERGSRRYVELMKGLKLTGKWGELKRYLEIEEGRKVSDSEVTRLLANLVDAGFVEKVDEEYRVADPVLRENVDKITC
ncbi:MAG: ATP-binding protein [Candidatus Aramenus sp.]|jgi:AAA+ ATPase superfamily predicted ATPase|nr:ATP-binding protein [Candidatus Aramenus sp.]